MATKFDATITMQNTTDAFFRQWCQFVFDTIVTTGGWVQTADTGQMNFATVTHPLALNTIMGYIIIRMADTLQATAPVYLKMEFGSGSAANTPQITITFGTGSNGTGTLTGAMGGSSMQCSAGTSSVLATHCFGSADTSRFQLMLFTSASFVNLVVISVERTKDSTGADTSAGLLTTWGNNGGPVFTAYYIRTGGAQPTTETGINLVMSNLTSSAFSSDIGVGFPIHFRGIAQQAGLGVIAVNSGDFVAEAQFSLSVYGATRTYQLGVGNTSQIRIATGNTGFSDRATTRVGIRYD